MPSISLYVIAFLLVVKIQPAIAQQADSSFLISGAIYYNEPCSPSSGKKSEIKLKPPRPVGRQECWLVLKDSNSTKLLNYYYDDIAVKFRQPMFTHIGLIKKMKTITTNTKGHFNVTLPAGTYFITCGARVLKEIKIHSNLKNLYLSYPQYPPCSEDGNLQPMIKEKQ